MGGRIRALGLELAQRGVEDGGGKQSRPGKEAQAEELLLTSTLRNKL